MIEAPETLDGWFALHDLRSIDRRAWNSLPDGDRAEIMAEAVEVVGSFEAVSVAQEGWSLSYQILGHKADLLTMHLRPEVGQLVALEERFQRTRLAGFTTRTYSYLSVIELALHGAQQAENIEDTPFAQARLRPPIPATSEYICFYPMDKKREGANNWYLLGSAERVELMKAHGRTGRKYAGQLTQIITGSMGLDDWEWGVTLFSDQPLAFKKLIYEMRFDEVSARYALFGPFYVGRRLRPEGWADWLRTT